MIIRANKFFKNIPVKFKEIKSKMKMREAGREMAQSKAVTTEE